MPLDLSQRRAKLTTEVVAQIGDGHPYYAYHAPRYVTLLRLLAEFLVPREQRILDIGPTSFSDLLHRQFGLPVDSLGFAPDEPLSRGQHVKFDLNDAQWPERWRNDLPQYDAVVMAEVIEHLHTSPALVLAFLRTVVRPGGVLIVQTPNAVRLGTRVKLLLGRHPFQLIAEDTEEPAHFREYTLMELSRYATSAGFDVVAAVHDSYFDLRYSAHDGVAHGSAALLSAKNKVYHALPQRLRMGITLVLRRPEAERPSTQ